MVCISCIVIPLVLFIWHRFLQPVFLKFWNPWAKVEDKTAAGGENEGGAQQHSDSDGTATSALKCPFSSSSKNSSQPEEAAPLSSQQVAANGHTKSE